LSKLACAFANLFLSWPTAHTHSNSDTFRKKFEVVKASKALLLALGFILQPDGYYVIDSLLRTRLKPFFAGASKKLDSLIDEMFKPLVPEFGLAYVDFLPLEFGYSTAWVLFPEDVAANILRSIAGMCKKEEDPAVAIERIVMDRRLTEIQFKSLDGSCYMLSMGSAGKMFQTNVLSGFKRSCSFYKSTGQPYEPSLLECGTASMNIEGTQTRKDDRDTRNSFARFGEQGFLKAFKHDLFHMLKTDSEQFREVADRYDVYLFVQLSVCQCLSV
jgi:hypothetical protein